MLLNIGPKPDGTIPDEEAAILREIGNWLAVNGDSIYGTRPWKVYGEGPTQIIEGHFTDTSRNAFTPQDIRFTTKENTLFALLLADPGESVVTTSLTPDKFPAEKIKYISLMGLDGQLGWSQNDKGLTIYLPEYKSGEHTLVLKIETSDLVIG